MKVVIKDKEYFIKFKHTQNEEVRHTECTVMEGPSKETSLFKGVGYSKCHPNDNFSKEKGRQYSLAKALEDCSFTKSERGDIWHTYRTWNKERF